MAKEIVIKNTREKNVWEFPFSEMTYLGPFHSEKKATRNICMILVLDWFIFTDVVSKEMFRICTQTFVRKFNVSV